MMLLACLLVLSEGARLLRRTDGWTDGWMDASHAAVCFKRSMKHRRKAQARAGTGRGRQEDNPTTSQPGSSTLNLDRSRIFDSSLSVASGHGS